MQNSMVVFTFSVFDWKYTFSAYLVQKIKIVSLSWNLVPRLILTYRIQWMVMLPFFRLQLEIPFLDKFSPKLQNCLFIWKLVLRHIRICRIQWCSLFLLLTKYIYPFFDKFSPRNQNCQIKLKFGTKANSNMQNSKVVYTLSVFDWKYPLWANLIQKIKIVSLSWNLVPRLIWLCGI